MANLRLKELREQNGFKSQQAFADAFGVAQSTVGGWESGKREPNYETTIKLARFFKVPIDYLLCMPGVPNIYLDDAQQEAIYKIMKAACKKNDITEGEAVVRAKISDNFFPRLRKTLLHQASESDLMTVATYLCVQKEVSEILSKDVTLDDFTYAMREESKHLSEESKATLLSLARQLKSSAKLNKNGKIG